MAWSVSACGIFDAGAPAHFAAGVRARRLVVWLGDKGAGMEADRLDAVYGGGVRGALAALTQEAMEEELAAAGLLEAIGSAGVADLVHVIAHEQEVAGGQQVLARQLEAEAAELQEATGSSEPWQQQRHERR